MKTIIHFNTFDFGGAASAAYRFHKNLQNEKYISYFFVASKTVNDDSVIVLNRKVVTSLLIKVENRIDSTLNIYNSDYNFFDRGWSGFDGVLEILLERKIVPDIIVLHWISWFIEPDEVSRIVDHFGCRVYWYLMDMAPLTGGCHYAWDCLGYIKSCENCPAVPFYMSRFPKRRLVTKSEFVRRCQVVALCGSSFLSSQIKSSIVFRDAKIVKLMVGIDPDIFTPLSVSLLDSLKIKMGIPLNKKVILVGASNVSDKRKGLPFILEALRIFKERFPLSVERVFILTLGRSGSISPFFSTDLPGKHIDFLFGDCELAKAYQVADIFISASIEDSGPMMINESIMTGTPVLSFRMGVAEDLIVPGQTGYLARLGDAEDLANGLFEFVNKTDSEMIDIKRNCRKLGLAKTSSKIQIMRFMEEIF